MATILLSCVTAFLALTWWPALAADLKEWPQCMRATGGSVTIYAGFARRVDSLCWMFY